MSEQPRGTGPRTDPPPGGDASIEPRPATAAPEPAGAELAAARGRARRDRVFGEVLPATTRDESGQAWNEPLDNDGDLTDEWLRRQRPPHHGT